MSLGYADFANGVFNGWNVAGYVSATWGYIDWIVSQGQIYAPGSLQVMGADGKTPVTIYYLQKQWW